MTDIGDLLEGAEILRASESCMTVSVDGVEVYVGPTVKRSGCDCCGDIRGLAASYNRPEEDRIENHGEADPLGLDP